MLVDILKSESLIDKNSVARPVELSYLDYEFFKISEITYEEKAPRREVVENILGALRLKGVNFVYLILGDEEGIGFYVGVSKKAATTGILGIPVPFFFKESELELDIDDVANLILKANIQGNSRGSKIERLNKKEKLSLKEKLSSYGYIAEVDGIPDVNEEAENFQGVDRLVDTMSGDNFAVLIIAEALELDELIMIEKELYKIYDKLSPMVKKSIQISEAMVDNETETKTRTETNSSSDSTTKSESDSTTKSTTTSTNKQTTSGSTTESGGESKSDTNSSSTQASNSTTKTNSLSDVRAFSKAKIKNETKTTNIEFAKKELEEWLRYIDEVLLKRVNYAKGKGGFKSGIYLFSDTKGKIKKLGNTFISLFSGVKENKLPLRYSLVTNENHKKAVLNFNLPRFELNLSEAQREKMILYSRIEGNEWLSTRELSIVASLPKKEVIGLRLKEEVLFGLNVGEKEGFELGELLHYGNPTKKSVKLNKDDLNKHIFISGVTGSGKTTTAQKILLESKLPFLVIEPAKTEYRALLEKEDVLIFTLGDEKIAPFRINPFEIFKNEPLTSRVDMIKAAIESSFDMEAAIPQIIESAIYRAYEKKGWDIGLDMNLLYEDPWEKGAFPTFSDVLEEVERVVEEQNFDERLHKDYVGSIKARLQSFLVGNKRFMLNTKKSFDFKKLLEKRVVLELENIKNPDEKAFIMGIILINLNEALKELYYEKKAKNEQFYHITLIEEAHRLLSRYEPGDSLNKKRGVEAFSDMLAEVRKYGESLIIADQIPNKLTPEVLKNTNTKIVHRLFAEDDKQTIGNSMSLNEEQKNFLSKLNVGEAVVFNQEFFNPVHIKVKRLTNTTSLREVGKEEIIKKWEEYFKEERGYENPHLILQFEKLFGVLLDSIDKKEKRDKIILPKLKELLSKIGKDEAKRVIKEFYEDERDIDEIVDIILNEEYGLKLKKLRR